MMVRLTDYPVDILLSTYNGAWCLRELLSSVFSQSHQAFKLIIRDDGSSDSTLTLIKEYERIYPNQIQLIEDGVGRVGPAQSFSRLMQYSDAEFTMFCDQDDIWLSNKIEVTLRKMLKAMEEAPESPLLVHTDLLVVNSKSKVISKSMWRYQHLDPRRDALSQLLLQNIVTGCTVMINRQLRYLVGSIPQPAIMHDWWLALVASTYSGIRFSEQPTLLYRQHPYNCVGAKEYSFFALLRKMRDTRARFDATLQQASCFRTIYGEKIDTDRREIVDSLLSVPSRNILGRLVQIRKYRMYKHGILRNIGLFLILFLF